MQNLPSILVPITACVLSYALIVLLRPWLVRYALSRPNARSSHTIPTPQGGGVAVVIATLLVASVTIAMTGIAPGSSLIAVFVATIFIAIVGAVDDLKTVDVLPRLFFQACSVTAVLASLPASFHLFDMLPLWFERAVLLLGGLWFVNLVNFMDGIDLITAAEIIPVATALSFFGIFGNLPANTTLVTLALTGAMIGFVPFNRPVAKVFLGDVGSLPIGLLTGWCLLQLAGSGALAAAFLLPLYYICDATLTLLRRLKNGERVWSAHRSHYYQQAMMNGFTVTAIVRDIFALNILLAALAAISLYCRSAVADTVTLLIGAIAVGCVLVRFSRPRTAHLN